MKVPSLTEFSKQAQSSLDLIVNYLTIEMNRNLRELVNCLRSISLSDNFESFEFTGTITANSELAIRNQLRGGVVPSKRIIVRGDTISPYVVDGDSAWTQNYIYLKNTHATLDATLTVVFLK